MQQIEKDDELLEVCESNGTKYYIFNNFELLYACWTCDNYECYISGDFSLDELHGILDSIQGGE